MGDEQHQIQPPGDISVHGGEPRPARLQPGWVDRAARRVVFVLAVPALVAPTVVAASIATSFTTTSFKTPSSGTTDLTTRAPADPPGSFTADLIAVGTPDVNRPGAARAGAVEVFPAAGDGQVLNEQSLGLAGPNEGGAARFGASVVKGDLNGDGYTDLLVGAPGVPAQGHPGRVDVLLGSATGFTSAGARTLTSPGKAGDEFGAAIAVSSRGGDSAVRDLWIGAPGHDVGTHPNAGAVYRYSISTGGQVSRLSTLTQNSANVPGAAESNDRFGEVLAPTVDGVVVGVPHEDVGSAQNAGAIQRLRTTDAGVLIAGVGFDQNSPGVTGTAEAGDRFGTVVTAYGYAVGIPGEDVGTRPDAGSVQLFDKPLNTSSSLVPAFALTQNSPGVPGSAEAGDRFGAAVTAGVFNCLETYSVAIGSPGEDFGSIRDLGSVTLTALPIGADLNCPTVVLRQGPDFPRSPETGDAAGTALGTITGAQEDENDRLDTLLIGVPGEDIGITGSHLDTGRAILWDHRGNVRVFGSQTGDPAQLRFGSVFAGENR